MREQRNALRVANADLMEARNQAEEATRAKSTFLAMMSHEIRTPMNGVMSMAEMLEQTELTEDQRGLAGVIRNSGSALLTIINDILDFSKIEAGKLDIERAPFSLVELVEATVELLAPRAEEKGLELAAVIDPAVPDHLLGDAVRVRQIFLNLAGNALKFTERGSVLVRVGLAPGASPARPMIRAEVIDTGIGLTEEQQGRLFKAFSQADASTARKFGGTGLGLSISQRLCELMQGRIGVRSAAGAGSTFWFELTFDHAPAPPVQAHAIADARVALVGFGAAAHESMVAILAAAGVTPAVSSGSLDDGMAAVGGAGEGPMIVFLSAETHGLQALSAGGRAVHSDASAKIILVASRQLASTLAEADRRRFFATTTLPLRRGRITQLIAAALGRAALEECSAAPQSLTYQPPSVGEARAAGVLILVAEDNTTNQIVITHLLNQRGYAAEIAKDGAEALRLIEANPPYGLLLTDFHMPEMDGFVLTAELRRREQDGGRRLPIVALTADALPGTARLCKDAGMDGYLTKPIDSKLLTAELERWLPGAAALRRPAARGGKASTEPIKIDPKVFDMERLLETFGALTPEVGDFLAQLIDRSRALSAAVMSAMAAGDLAEARHRIHALKGVGHSAGAVRLGQLAGDVQDCLDGGDANSAQFFVAGLEATVEELAREIGPLEARARAAS
jgi:CheY-like chemotaxis protein/HPt (histidine-containing phosphotransfer) domain-containing protein